jgi:hypothetical protein
MFIPFYFPLVDLSITYSHSSLPPPQLFPLTLSTSYTLGGSVGLCTAALLWQVRGATGGTFDECTCERRSSAYPALPPIINVKGKITFSTLASPDGLTPNMRTGLRTTLAEKCGVGADRVELIVEGERRRRQLLSGIVVDYIIHLGSTPGSVAVAATFEAESKVKGCYQAIPYVLPAIPIVFVVSRNKLPTHMCWGEFLVRIDAPTHSFHSLL